MARILVIQLERLGDLILSTPLLRELLEDPKGHEVEILVLEELIPALEGMERLAKVRAFPSNLVGELDQELAAQVGKPIDSSKARSALASLNLGSFDRVINLTHAAFGCWLCEQIPAEKKDGGILTANGEWLFRGPWRTYFVAMMDFRDENRFHQADLARGEAGEIHPPKTGDRSYVSAARQLSFSLSAGRRVVLNPGSSDPQRRWPVAFIAQLAGKLHSKGLTPILMGSAADRGLCEAIVEACSFPVHDFSGKTTVPQAAKLLAESELLISHDTGAIHLAASVGTPVIGIHGGNAHFRETAAWSEGNWVLEVPELERLSPESLFAIALKRLGLSSNFQLPPGVQAWESYFQDSKADPLGGLCFRSLDGRKPDELEIFLQALRRSFAWEFCGRKGKVSLNDLKREHSGKVPEWVKTARELSQRLASFAQLALQASEKLSAGNLSQAKKLGQKLQRELESLQTFSEKNHFLRPVSAYHRWVLKMLPPLSDLQVFQSYSRVSRQAGSILSSALDSYLGSLEKN